MDFLNKLYESNYFGIGLFAVISFLVIMFLIVLFFGKKDEKKRKLEETKNLNMDEADDAFKQIENGAPVEIKPDDIEINNGIINDNSAGINTTPIEPLEVKPEIDTEINNGVINDNNVGINIAPVEPLEVKPDFNIELNNGIINDNSAGINITPVEPLEVKPEPNMDLNSINIAPVAPINYDVDNSPMGIIEEPQVINPLPVEEDIIKESGIEPIKIDDMPVVEDIKPINFMPNMDIGSNQDLDKTIITPIITEPTKFDARSDEVFEMPKEEVQPIIKPIIEEEKETLNVMPTIVEEPVISDSYYKPVVEEKVEDIKVPNIDFDALAKSISDELDELEKQSKPQEEQNTNNNLNSIYVASSVDMPKKIDLPTRKDE